MKAATEPRVHDKAAPVEQTAQVAGKDETTQTPNPKALFKMNKGGADEPDNAGNPRAPQGEDKASGDGPNLRIPVRRAGKSSSALRWTPRAR